MSDELHSPAADVAGRIFTVTERSERQFVDTMRDLDEIIANVRRLYPGNTWSRLEILLMFFLDDACDRLKDITAQLTPGDDGEGWQEPPT